MAEDLLLHLDRAGAVAAPPCGTAPCTRARGLRAPVDAGAGAPARRPALPRPARPAAARRRPGPADRSGAVRAGRPRRTRGACGSRTCTGRCPVTAVVAVVPYRPPAPSVLPAPDDVARTGAGVLHLGAGPSRGRRRRRPGGVAVLDPDYALSRDNNRLLLTAPVDADDRRADGGRRSAGTPAGRTAPRRWLAGRRRVAAELGRRGWEVEELLLMARPAGPGPDGAPRRGGRPARGARVLGPLLAAGRLTDGRDLDERGRPAGRPRAPQRPGRGGHRRRRPRGGPGRGRPAQLRVDGATAAVDSVLTDPEARGRGLRATPCWRGSSTSRHEAGCDLVVLEAAADDWPRHWYARRGFEVGRASRRGTSARPACER